MQRADAGSQGMRAIANCDSHQPQFSERIPRRAIGAVTAPMTRKSYGGCRRVFLGVVLDVDEAFVPAGN